MPVVIATGATCQRIGIDPNIGEMDGPPGAVALARAIGRGLRSVPILLTEEGQVDSLAKAAHSIGLTRTDLRGSLEQATRSAYNTSVVVEGFPSDDEAARKAAISFLDRFVPAAIVTVEKAGMNEVGVYHSSLGFDTSEGKARIDYLVAQAAERGILTIGVGDGGNEIGMGLIRDAIREHIPYGKKCQCPCGAGIAPAVNVDVLVTASVSNWGAYGIIACLSAILSRPDVLHTSELCERAIRGSAWAGYLDPSGYADIAVDGLPLRIHLAFLELLNIIIEGPFRELQKLGYGGGKRTT
jgi:hypothetical protein